MVFFEVVFTFFVVVVDLLVFVVVVVAFVVVVAGSLFFLIVEVVEFVVVVEDLVVVLDGVVDVFSSNPTAACVTSSRGDKSSDDESLSMKPSGNMLALFEEVPSVAQPIELVRINKTKMRTTRPRMRFPIIGTSCHFTAVAYWRTILNLTILMLPHLKLIT